ncbi:MAG TPA: POTRA domain-containing protein [Terriglobia bacterium]|nr:POTRA domain-containing protein [Terriglobia bacterium]
MILDFLHQRLRQRLPIFGHAPCVRPCITRGRILLGRTAARLASLFLPVVLAPLPCSLARASGDALPWGRPVADIRLQSDAQMTAGEFSAQIVQQKGQPLDRDKVAESLKNLYATGRFRELRADAEPDPRGVVLVFVASARFFIGLVRVEGYPKLFSAATLASTARLRLGQPLTEADLTAAERRIAATLADNGYYQAKVSHAVETHPKTQEADVVVTLASGAPARLSGIEFDGRTVETPARLAAVAGWKVGMQLTQARVERGLSKLRRFYLKHERYAASSRVERRVPDAQRATERLVVRVEAGPVIRAHVMGAKIRASELKSLLPMYTEGLTDDLSLAAGQRNLQAVLERRGYYNASVKWNRSVQPDKVDVTYSVTLDSRGEFVGYGFKGTPPLPPEELETTLQISPADFAHRRGIFSRDMLTHDVHTMTALLQARGYLDAKITPQIDDQHDHHPGHLFVTFQIEEGQPKKVRNVVFTGVDSTTEKSLLSLLVTKSGQPYSPSRADTDRDSILTYFADRGYSQVTAGWEATPVTPEHQVDIRFEVQPGAQERVQHLIVMGARHTRANVIGDQLRIGEGAPLNQSQVLESQRSLYDLGLFNQVQIAAQDPEVAETERTVLVSVEEAHRWTLGYGGGLDVQRLGAPQGQYKASPRLSLQLSRIDVDGRAQTFSLQGRLSNLETGGSATYLIPRLGGHRDLSLRVNALVDQTRDILTFTSQRREVSLSLEKQFSKKTFLLTRYAFRDDSVSSLNIPVQEVPLSSQSALVAGFGATYVNDRRDNPVDAAAGSYSLVDVFVANTGLGSQSDFGRLSGQNATYYRLNKHVIFARNTRLGLEETYGRSQESNEPSVNVIPLPELFFMGGSESHRGFAINQAGPRDPCTINQVASSCPIGGKAQFLNQLELRFPFERYHYGLVLFHDAGNVFSSVDTMRLLKFHQSSPTDFDYTVHAVGVGVRYQTPVGPLRLDIGYNLNPPLYQVQPANSPLQIHQLPRIQFSLSVGQAF